MKSVVVTGSSSGIGKAVVRHLVGRGWRAFADVRRVEDGERLVAELGPGVHPLVFDVRDEEAVARAAREVEGVLAGRPLAGLVNNAGVGNPGPIFHQPMAELREQIEINLLGAFVVTKAFGPLLAARAGEAGGRIVTMSSIGGIMGQPFASAYCASKFGLEGFSESLRRELWREGIDVVVVAPSAVATPAWGKAAEHDFHRFDDTPYGPDFARMMERVAAAGSRYGLRPEVVAETVWEALTHPRPAARYAPGRLPAVEQQIPSLLPRRLVDRFYGAGGGLGAVREPGVRAVALGLAVLSAAMLARRRRTGRR